MCYVREEKGGSPRALVSLSLLPRVDTSLNTQKTHCGLKVEGFLAQI